VEHLLRHGDLCQETGLRQVQSPLQIRSSTNLNRRLFERVIAMKFSSKKMKFFFKKYLDYEKKHGDEDAIEHVKQAAMDYVQRMQTDE
jgi:hypothetical protein